jgi:hypothetical protein
MRPEGEVKAGEGVEEEPFRLGGERVPGLRRAAISRAGSGLPSEHNG